MIEATHRQGPIRLTIPTLKAEKCIAIPRGLSLKPLENKLVMLPALPVNDSVNFEV